MSKDGGGRLKYIWQSWEGTQLLCIRKRDSERERHREKDLEGNWSGEPHLGGNQVTWGWKDLPGKCHYWGFALRLQNWGRRSHLTPLVLVQVAVTVTGCDVLWAPCIRALISFLRALLSWPNYIPKTLPLHTITLGLGFQRKNFGGNTNLQCTAQVGWLLCVQHWTLYGTGQGRAETVLLAGFDSWLFPPSLQALLCPTVQSKLHQYQITKLATFSSMLFLYTCCWDIPPTPAFSLCLVNFYSHLMFLFRYHYF